MISSVWRNQLASTIVGWGRRGGTGAGIFPENLAALRALGREGALKLLLGEVRLAWACIPWRRQPGEGARSRVIFKVTSVAVHSSLGSCISGAISLDCAMTAS